MYTCTYEEASKLVDAGRSTQLAMAVVKYLSEDVWLSLEGVHDHPGVPGSTDLSPHLSPRMPAVLMAQFLCTCYSISLKGSSPDAPSLASPPPLGIYSNGISPIRPPLTILSKISLPTS